MKKSVFAMVFVVLTGLSAFAQNGNSSCPVITIVGPNAVVNEGEPIFFSASVSGGDRKYNVKYRWKIDQGKIIIGQETTTIHVSTEGIADTVITVTFEIEGLPEGCQNTAKEVGVVASTINCSCYDEFGDIPFKDVMQRIDSFLLELKLNPDDKGFILVKTNKDESIADVKKYIQVIINHTKFRKGPVEKITFAIKKSDSRLTRLMRIPKTTRLPECEDCEIIQGSDL